ncbi:MAG: hypothetical protein AAGA58_14025 [Verrucomicrobiota bacterium]
MSDLVEVAGDLQDFCQANDWQFCFIGGLVVQHWGEPRMTIDVDLTLLTGFGGEEKWIDALLANWSPRIDGARNFALANRVLLLKTNSGVGIDIALGGLEFEKVAIDRAREVEVVPGRTLRFCTAEDLIIMKAFANRPRDWEDIQGIIVRQGNSNLDWTHIFHHLRPLAEAKENPELVTRLESLSQRVSK